MRITTPFRRQFLRNSVYVIAETSPFNVISSLLLFFSTTTSQEAKFCKIKSVTRDKKRANNTGIVASIRNYVILMAFY